MNLYLIEQSVNNHYDTFDSAVIVARNEAEARICHPSKGLSPVKIFRDGRIILDHWFASDSSFFDEWCEPADVNVTLIGIDANNRKSGDIICASFRAG